MSMSMGLGMITISAMTFGSNMFCMFILGILFAIGLINNKNNRLGK